MKSLSQGNKNKYLSIIAKFSRLEGSLNHHSFLIDKLSKNFEEIFIINSENLELFSKKKKYNLINAKKKIPSNYTFFDPQNSKDLSKFLDDKEILVINFLARGFENIRIHYLLKKFKVKQVLITNHGHVAPTQIVPSKHFFKLLAHFFKYYFAKKLTLILSIFGLISKIEIQFLCVKKIVDGFKNSFYKKALYKNNWLFSKEYMLVNSMSYDMLMENKFSLSEDYIVHIDASLNYYHEVELRGKLDEETVSNHYYYLEKFLKKLSNEFNKEVIVCIHPNYNLEEHQEFFKDFKVIKFKTREFIYKSILVTTFDSTAIVDAILLKKKIIGFESDFMTRNEITHAKTFAKKGGYMVLNTKKDYNFNKEEILFQLNQNLSNYDNYISDFHCFEPNISGTNKIIKTLKERFF